MSVEGSYTTVDAAAYERCRALAGEVDEASWQALVAEAQAGSYELYGPEPDDVAESGARAPRTATGRALAGFDAATIVLGVCLVGATRRLRADAPVSDYLVHDGFDHRAALRAALKEPAPAIAAWDGLRATMRAAEPAGLPWWLAERARACDWWCGVTDPATALALGEALHSTGALEAGALALEAQGRPGGDLADLLAIAELLTTAGRAGRWVLGGAAGT